MTGSDVDTLFSSTINIRRRYRKPLRCFVQDDKRLLPASHEAGQGLALMSRAFKAASSQLGNCSLGQSAAESLEACKAKTKVSETIFKDIGEASADLRFERSSAALQQHGKGSTVEMLTVGMMTDLCELDKDVDAIKAGTGDQVQRLEQASSKLFETG